MYLKRLFVFAAFVSVLCISCDDKDEVDTVERALMKIQMESSPIDLSWHKGEQLKVSSGTLSSKEIYSIDSDGKLSGISSASPLRECDRYYALYPFGVDGVSCDIGSGTTSDGVDYPVQFRSDIPVVQTGVLGSISSELNLCAGTGGKDGLLKFRNMYSLLKIEIQHPSAAKLVVKCAGGKYLSGPFSFYAVDTDSDYDFDGFYVRQRGGASGSVTLLPPSGEKTFPSGVYYMVVLPDLCGGTLDVSVYDGREIVVDVKQVVLPAELERNGVVDLGSVIYDGIDRRFSAKLETAEELAVSWQSEKSILMMTRDFSKSRIYDFSVNGENGLMTSSDAIEDSDRYYAFYPYTEDCSISRGSTVDGVQYEVKFDARIPDEQRIAPGQLYWNGNICAGVASKEGVYTFRNLYSLFKIDIQIASAAKIILSTENGSLAGRFSCYAADSDNDYVFDSFTVKPEMACSSITVLPQDGSRTFQMGEYYVSAAPVAASGKVNVLVYNAAEEVIFDRSVDLSSYGERNVCSDLGYCFAVRVEDVAYLFDNSIRSQYHAATITETIAGDILVAAMGGKTEGAHDSCIWMTRLKKGSTQWSAQELLFEPTRHGGPETTWCNNPVLFQLPTSMGGDILLFYKIGQTSSYGSSIGYMTRSADGGQTFKEEIKIGPMNEVCGPDKNPPIIVEGTLVAPSEGPRPDGTDWFEHYEKSTDAGKTWTRINVPKTSLKGKQPALVLHKDGRIQSLMRSDYGNILTAFSSNYGMTWTTQERTTLKNNSSGICAAALADGRIALVYDDNDSLYDGRKTGPRYPLKLVVSSDGLNWKEVMTIEPDTQGGFQEYSYPTMIQASDGSLMIVYTYCGPENNYTSRANIKYIRIRLL